MISVQQFSAARPSSGRFRKRTALAPLAGAALMLGTAACASGGSGAVYSSDFTAGYDPRSMSAAMSRAPLLVETYGSPAAGQTTAEVARASALALRQHGPAWLPRNYTANPADAGSIPYRLRIAYNLPRSFNRQLLCENEMSEATVEAARSPNEVSTGRTLAAVCRGKSAVGIAEGAPSVSDIKSPVFAEFVGRLGRTAMPRRNPVLKDDCLFRFCD